MTGIPSPRRAAAWVARRLPGRSGAVAAGRPARRDPFERYASLDSPTLLTVPTFRHDPDLDATPSLCVLMPHLLLDRMTGGPNTILNVTARLASRGVRLRYVATFDAADADLDPLRRHIAALVGADPSLPGVEFASAMDPGSPPTIGRNDVFMATWWPTAHVARAVLPLTRAGEFVYFIQDFEPGFYPWSTNYALAAATYGFPARALFNESLLRSHFAAERIGRFANPAVLAQSMAIEPAVDREVFRPRPESRPSDRPRPSRLRFYARPRNERNCFDLGLKVLRVAAQSGVFDGEPWEFSFIGADLPAMALSDRHEIRALPWLPYREYGALLGESDLLLSLMLSPHTSYPPLEMAATGGTVVTNTFGVKTAEALARISPHIIAVEPEVESLVDAVRLAVERRRTGKPVAPAAADPAPLHATWDDALVDALPWLIAAVDEIRAGGRDPIGGQPA